MTYIAQNLLALMKVLAVLFFIAIYMLTTLLWGCVGLLGRNRWKLTQDRAIIVGFFARIGLFLLNVRVEVVGEVPRQGQNYLIVSNHLSYIDILIISHILPSCFVTSMETRNTPILGQITKLAGCLFVERRSRRNLQSEIGEIDLALNNGLNVVIFPEATSTDGSEVLRFRRPLYNGAIRSQRSILPMCLNYHSIDGEPISIYNRDDVYWYGDMDFLDHLWRLAKRSSVKVRLHVLQEIAVRPEFDDILLADQSHRLVSATFQKCLI